MTTFKYMSTTALIAVSTMAIIGVSVPKAADASSTETDEFTIAQIVDADTVPIPSVMQDPKPLKAFLKTLFDAQLYLRAEEKIPAKANIERALEQLEVIENLNEDDDGVIDQADQTDFGFRKVIQVRVSDVLVPSRVIVPMGTLDSFKATPAVVPLGQDELSKAKIAEALDVNGLKEKEIRDIEVNYIKVDVDKSFVRDRLESALEEITEDDFLGAHFDLVQIQLDMLEDRDSRLVPARMKAQDNIGLARFLFEEKRYDAARKALNAAGNAIDRMDDIERDIATLREVRLEFEELEKEIAEEDPTLFEKIDKKLEEWWDKLS